MPNDSPAWRWKSRSAGPLAGWLNRVFGPCGEGFGILMYHRVARVPVEGPHPTWNVTPARFERQISGLLDRGWTPLSLGDVLSRHRLGLTIPRSSFVVTFDDGYANNVSDALPILRKYEVPATVFIATAYLDRQGAFPNDDWPSAGTGGVPSITWRPMTTEEGRQLAEDPLVDLGCHTHTHADFRGQPDLLFEDLLLNRAVLEEKFGVTDPAFAFPYGTVSAGFAGGTLSDAARRAGVTCALTTEDELVGPDADPFVWGRFTAEGYDTAETLAGKLGGWFTRLRHVFDAARSGGKGA
ncbi:MAG: polysaccharide deacetylase family protein [Planctomycetota bacterium]